MRYRDGVMEIEACSRVKLVQKGRLLLAVVEGDVQAMSAEEAVRLVDEQREARMKEIMGEAEPTGAA